MKRKIFTVILLLGLINTKKSFSEQKKEITIFTSSRIPPWILIQENELSGIGGDFIKEAISKKYKFIISDTPFTRTQHEGKANSNGLVLPISRDKVRESEYQWITKIFEDPICVFTLKPNNPVKNSEEISKRFKKIGALMGAASKNIAKEKNFEHLLEYTHDPKENAQRLKNQKVDAWISSLSIGTYIWKNLSFPIDELQCGTPIAKYIPYVATSLGSDKAFVDDIIKLTNEYKKSEAFKNLLKRYNIKYTEPNLN